MFVQRTTSGWLAMNFGSWSKSGTVVRAAGRFALFRNNSTRTELNDSTQAVNVIVLFAAIVFGVAARSLMLFRVMV